ncbi:hypothetical protein EOD39_8265 [Acipenser ruthenus]|uniref:Uncharacterized protein n=1 Tax=Acipenser ruthenus TaxID=7906 RepID=A0A444U4B2_ACIRT|nr:hypothetical protein EOD39_8265 [Acipenser ruthenus]
MQSEVTVEEGLLTATEIVTISNVTIMDRLSSSSEIQYPGAIQAIQEQSAEGIPRDSDTVDYYTLGHSRTKNNLLFYTQHPSACHIALCSTYNNIRKTGIGGGRQLTAFENSDAHRTMLNVNVYNNGTIMVQGSESRLGSFEHSFPALRERELSQQLRDEVHRLKTWRKTTRPRRQSCGD